MKMNGGKMTYFWGDDLMTDLFSAAMLVSGSLELLIRVKHGSTILIILPWKLCNVHIMYHHMSMLDIDESLICV